MYVFVKGVCLDPFGESIIRNRPRTFAELRRLAVEHIVSEAEVCVKRTSIVPSRPRGQTRNQPARVNETTTGRKKPEGRRPYDARKPQPRGPAGGDLPARERERPARYNFVVELKDLIVVPNIAERGDRRSLIRCWGLGKTLGVNSTRLLVTTLITACRWVTN